MTAGRDVADAVLNEGYVLYPYRASSTKNRFRFIFGVLAPRAWSEAGGCEPSWLQTELLVEPQGDTLVQGTLRFLQVRRRVVEEFREGLLSPVESLTCDGQLHVSWDEGETREVAFHHALTEGESTHPFTLEGQDAIEVLRDPDGQVRGRVVRTMALLQGDVRVQSRPVDDRLWKLTVRVENLTATENLRSPREAVLPACCVGTHLLFTVTGGAFVSLLDPPEWARAAAEACRSVRAYPVLLGQPGGRDAVLASPIILYDHPRIAPESPGDFYDAAEIDELLALRTANLTPDEKRQARATDPRAAAIVDRVDALPPEMLERLHGAVRDLERAEMVPRTPRPTFAPGMRVRLRPGARRTDAQDLLYSGLIARIEEVREDVDGRTCLAVTVEGDPAAELHRWYGRFHYFHPDEVELLPEAAS